MSTRLAKAKAKVRFGGLLIQAHDLHLRVLGLDIDEELPPAAGSESTTLMA